MSSIMDEIKDGQTSSGPSQTHRIGRLEDAQAHIQFNFLFGRPPQFNVNSKSKLKMTVAHIFILPSVARLSAGPLVDLSVGVCVRLVCGWQRMLASSYFKSHQYKSNASKLFSLPLKNIEYIWGWIFIHHGLAFIQQRSSIANLVRPHSPK